MIRYWGKSGTGDNLYLTNVFHIIPFFHTLGNGETDNKDKTLLVSPTSTLFNCTIWHSLCLQIVEIIWTEMCTFGWNLTGYWEESSTITSQIDSANWIQFTRYPSTKYSLFHCFICQHILILVEAHKGYLIACLCTDVITVLKIEQHLMESRN